jgi:hypothetical protein
MSLQDTPANNGGGRAAIREGFIRPDSSPPPTPNYESPQPPEDPGPHQAPPQQPLPSQVKLEQPPPEAPLSEAEQARQEIAAAAERWPVTVQLLYKPIMNDTGETVNKLTFREPRASDINRIGNPTRMLWDGEIIIEERKMTYIMAALCGILPPLLEAMDPRDWNACALRLRKYFLPDVRGWER